MNLLGATRQRFTGIRSPAIEGRKEVPMLNPIPACCSQLAATPGYDEKTSDTAVDWLWLV